MNNATYVVQGNASHIAARQHPILGWSISINNSEWISLQYEHPFNSVALENFSWLFFGPLYPDELKVAFHNAIQRQKLKEETEEKQKRLDKIGFDERLQVAEANAVSPLEEELQRLKHVEKEALARLAIAYLVPLAEKQLAMSMARGRINLVLAYVKDRALELSLREGDPEGIFLHQVDCQVTVKKPTDPQLAALLDGIIPFTK